MFEETAFWVTRRTRKTFWGKKQKITISFGVWAKEHQTFSRIFWQCCQICNLRIQTNIRRTKFQFNKHINLIFFFGSRTKNFSNFYRTLFRQSCQKCNVCLKKNILMERQFLRKTVDYEFVFWVWANDFLIFGINFSIGCRNCVLVVEGNLLRRTIWFTEWFSS